MKITICLDIVEPTNEIPMDDKVSLSYLKTLGHITYYQNVDSNSYPIDMNNHWFKIDPIGIYLEIDRYGDFTYEFDYPDDDTWIKRDEEIDKIL